MFQATPTTTDLDTFKDAAIILVGSLDIFLTQHSTKYKFNP